MTKALSSTNSAARTAANVVMLIATFLCNATQSKAQTFTGAESGRALSLASSNSLIASYEFTSNQVYAPELGTSAVRGNTGFDKSNFFGKTTGSDANPAIESRKNPVIAGILSLVIPGLGEYYVGDQIWRGAIFTGLEVGLWLEQMHWTSRGNDSTAAFQQFSDNYWSPQRYATYLNGLLKSRGIDSVAHGQDPTTINHAEGILDSLGFENFTHRLPITDRQQYYELISKYIQFTAGWDDDVTHKPEDSKHYQSAAQMRAVMNHQYEVATYFAWGIIANHILSAIDAALVARDHNTAIHLHGDMLKRYYQDGTSGYIPTAGIAYVF